MRFRMVLAAGMLVAGTTALEAHDQYHIVGVITARQPMMIVVKPKGPIASTVGLDEHTVVVRNDKQVKLADLKVGLTVVVDALGDTPEDMMAVFIRIVAPIKGGS